MARESMLTDVRGDGDRCAAVLQDLVDLRLNHGTEDEVSFNPNGKSG